LSEEFWEEDEEWEEDEDEEPTTPENCSMGWFSPGTEECEFCASNDFCRKEFEERIKRDAKS